VKQESRSPESISHKVESKEAAREEEQRENLKRKSEEE
jgi:hypothetical protein